VISQQERGHLRDLRIGEARIRLADGRKLAGAVDAHREGDVTEHTTSFSVSPFGADHHHVERVQGPFELEPVQSSAPRRVRRLGLFEEQSFVESGARIVEAPVHLRFPADPFEVRQRKWVGYRQRLETLAALPERTVEQDLVAGHEQIPGDVDHRHRGHQRVIRRHPTQPRLQRVEGHHPAVVKRQDLAIEHHVRAEVRSPRTDLGELCGDVLEVSTVESDLRAATMELAPDSVILVLNPDVLAEALDGFGRAGDGRCEHRAQGHEPARGRVAQTARPGEERRLVVDIRCARWGAYQVGDVSLRASDHFGGGMSTRRMTYYLREPVLLAQPLLPVFDRC